MSECIHHWTVTSECPFCLRQEIERLREDRQTQIAARKLMADTIAACETELGRLKATINADNKGIEQRLLAAKIEIERLRGLLREWADRGRSNVFQGADYDRRVREALGDD